MNETSIFDPERLAKKFKKLANGLAPLFLKNFTEGNKVCREKARGELVGKLDLKIERTFFKFLRKNFPDVPIVSEEAGGNWPPVANQIWLLDPLDGTHNSMAGIPLFGSMLALIRYKKVVFSAIFLPFEQILGRSGLYVAGRGWGAWEWNSSSQRRLAVSRETKLEKSFLLLEGPSKAFTCSLSVQDMIQRTVRCRINLSCAWSFTRMSVGIYPSRVDLLLCRGCQPWDTLPGCLLVEEAGGRVTDFEGNPWSIENYSNLIVSNGLVHEEALALLNKENRDG